MRQRHLAGPAFGQRLRRGQVLDKMGRVADQRFRELVERERNFGLGGAEDDGVALVELTGAPFLVDQVTTACALESLARGKARGLPVTATTDWSLDWPLPIGAPATLRLSLLSASEQIGPDVFARLELQGSVNARDHIGGTAPAQVRQAIARLRAWLDDAGKS